MASSSGGGQSEPLCLPSSRTFPTSPESEEYKCRNCNQVLNKPYQSKQCGHSYCQSFIEEMKKMGRKEFKCRHDGCDEILQLAMFFPDKAKDKDIKNFVVICPYGCGITYPLKHETRHELECSKVELVSCEYCKHKCRTSDLLNEHLKICPEKRCPFFLFGCKEDKTSPIQKHTFGQHLLFLLSSLCLQENIIRISSTGVETLFSVVEEKITGLSRILSFLMKTSDTKEVYNQIIKLRQEIRQLRNEDVVSTTNLMQSSLREILPRILEKLFQMSRRIECIISQSTAMQAEMETLLTTLNQLPAQQVYGEVIFKVPEFSKKRVLAIREKQNRIAGPGFYTHPLGYLFKPVVYPNGDGIGKDNYVSVFVTLCRGTFDATLKWPFQGKITIIVLNQKGGEVITHVFRADPMSNSFQRCPDSREANAATGVPRVMEMDKLRHPSPYLVDDTIFFHVKIDPSFDTID